MWYFSIAFLLLSSLVPSVLYAADDTFSCLSQSGPTIKLSGAYGYQQYKNRNFADNTKFDARSGTWKTQQLPVRMNLYPLNIGGGSNGCWAGGVVQGTTDWDDKWGLRYGHLDPTVGGNSAQIDYIGAPNFTVDGLRVDSGWDSFRAGFNSPNFILQNSWFSLSGDDCVENDNDNTGLIDDTLFESCHVWYSDTGKDPGPVTIQNSLAHLEPSMGVQCDPPCHKPGTKVWLKRKHNLKLKLYNNIFWQEIGPNAPDSVAGIPTTDADGVPHDDLVDCKNNLMVWTGPGEYPYYLDKSCFTVTKDKSEWDRAVQNWIDCHPKVAHLPGDPAANPSQCDPNAYGGGGGGTNIPGNGSSGSATVTGPCSLFASGSPAQTGFGVPWNVFSSAKELLLTSTCKTSSVDLQVGTGNQNHAVYKQGYIYRGSWSPFTLSGTPWPSTTEWLTGKGIYSYGSPPSGTTFWVGYTCSWSGTAWQCGCADAACAANYWQLQGVVR